MNRLHRWVCRSNLWKKALGEQLLPWALKGIDLGENVLEVGPGPGLATEILRHNTTHLTSIEIDRLLADSLKHRMSGTNVTVIEGDATRMPFEDNSFSGAVSFTMLHHVPSRGLQDDLLREVYRVLKPGGVFAGTDSTRNRAFQLFHLWDTCVPVDPSTFSGRLEAAGFEDVAIDVTRRAFRFRALHPRILR